MTDAKHLHVVDSTHAVVPLVRAQETPQRFDTVQKAAESSQLDLLYSLRERLAIALDAGRVPAHALDKITRQIAQFDTDIRALVQQAKQENGETATPVIDGVFDPEAV